MGCLEKNSQNVLHIISEKLMHCTHFEKEMVGLNASFSGN